VRRFDGSTVGGAAAIDPLGLVAQNFPVASLTRHDVRPGQGRLYDTLADDGRLFDRGFAFESNILEAESFVAAASGLSTVQGMTLAGGNLYYGPTAGQLMRVASTNGAPSGLPPRSAALGSTPSPGGYAGCSCWPLTPGVPGQGSRAADGATGRSGSR